MAGENILVVENNATLLQVVESALMRAEFHVASAGDHESSLALARSNEPALILMDSVISPPSPSSVESSIDATSPDAATVAGVGLCRALVADAALASIPVVLMVPKGEDVDTQYSQSPNVVDYITKPFSPDALLTMVAQVIGKNSGAASARRAATPPNPEPPPSLAAPADTALVPRARAVGESALSPLRVAIAERLQQRWNDARGKPADATQLPDFVADALPDDVLADLLLAHGFVGPSSEHGDEDLAGKLDTVSVSEVMSMLSQQGQTGTLRVTIGKAHVDVFFRAGRIELAIAAGIAEEFLLGRFTVDAGYLSPEVLAGVLRQRAKATTPPPLFGRDLVARALITAEQLKSAMRRQTAELVYECLRWSSGQFQFHSLADLPELATDAALSIAVDSLLLEGFRRVDEWRLIERDIHSLDLVFVRDDARIAALAQGTLTREEITVLDALTGKRSVRDVVRALRVGSFDVTKILYRLRRAQLIRPRVNAIATH